MKVGILPGFIRSASALCRGEETLLVYMRGMRRNRGGRNATSSGPNGESQEDLRPMRAAPARPGIFQRGILDPTPPQPEWGNRLPIFIRRVPAAGKTAAGPHASPATSVWSGTACIKSHAE